MISHIVWKQNKLILLDQRLLPNRNVYVKCNNYKMVCDAIRDMIVRGAPAIGVTAAYGIAQAVLEGKKQRLLESQTKMSHYFQKVCKKFAATRPTAVNLFWAIDRMKQRFQTAVKNKEDVCTVLIDEAENIYKEDIAINKAIGKHGKGLLKKPLRILTHCNAGALATAGFGTALGVIRAAHAKKKIKMVYVDETRPYLQGMRLTAWELMQERIPMTLVCDNMAGYFMGQGKIDAVIIGADRIAANGDTANKIGSFALSILAKHHKIPFWVAAPCSTIDLDTKTGKDIIIEERSSKEITHVGAHLLAPKGVKVANPSFDVTPASHISAIITEKGIVKYPFSKKLKSLF